MIDLSFLEKSENIPRRKNSFLKMLARFYFFFFRWNLEGEIPDVSKAVILVAPHTSNWDFVHLMMFSLLAEVKVSWLGKHTIFRFPVNRLFRYLGGIPVERSKRHNFVDKLSDEFAKRDKLILALSPEGTRSPVKKWHSSFYYIAIRLKIPVVLLGIDYKRKVFEFLPPIKFDEKTGKEEALNLVKSRFARFTPKYPEKFEF